MGASLFFFLIIFLSGAMESRVECSTFMILPVSRSMLVGFVEGPLYVCNE